MKVHRPPCTSIDRLHDWRVSVLGVDYCRACGLVGRWEPPHHVRTQRPVKTQAPGSKARTEESRPRRRGRAWAARVRACYERDGDGCFYCRRPVSMALVRLDHFIPRSKGGPDGLENRRAACPSCDNAKADQMPWEFMPERFKAPAA